MEKLFHDNLDFLNFEDEYDYDFSVNEVHIDTMDDFNSLLLEPFKQGKRLFYRGERINALNRPLLPTMFRDKGKLVPPGQNNVTIDSDYVFNFYSSFGRYVELYNNSFGSASKDNLYDLCAFSQHYMSLSPLIDFSASLYVALSFSIKGKHTVNDSPIIYTIEIANDENYTQDPAIAEKWIQEYRVTVHNATDGGPKIPRTSPHARLIDIASNDLMKFQKGVFLLLTDFNLVNKMYLTKNVRGDFRIVKHTINRDICGQITDLIEAEAPWYSFKNLMDISSGLNSAISSNSTLG
jgi:hypothetical protein